MAFKLWLSGAMLLTGAISAHAEYPVAGVQPSQRPGGAPVVTQVARPSGWEQQALHGVSKPHTGLDFLRDQGNWYTPFFHPNSPGAYDIRGLYRHD